MTIRIVTDSTCDLPEALTLQHNITVVPLYINFGTEGYLDGVEISRREFYERLPQSNPLPSTAVPGTDIFTQTYDQLANEGATEILSIHISNSLSATVDVALSAAEETSTVPVTVFDSEQLSLGTGLLVREAAKAAAEGQSMVEIVSMLKEMTARTYVFAALESLEYLRRSGRMNAAVAAFGNALKIKPLLKMNGGEPTAERVRTQKRATERLIELVTELGPLEEIALVHTNAAQSAENLYQQAKFLFSPNKNLLRVDVTPVLGANIGPGVVGFACVVAK